MRKVLLLLPAVLFLTVAALVYAIVAESNGNLNIGFLASSNQEQNEESVDKGAFTAPAPGDFDSKDRAVVSSIDTDDGLITFLNTTVNRYYTLSYDGLSSFFDRYGTAISAAQLKCGDIMDLTFRRGNKHLVKASVSPDSWTRTVRDGFDINSTRNEISFSTDKYSLGKRMVLLSGIEEISLGDFNTNDTIVVSGIDDTVYSICVEKGHGYLRLTGDEYFIGGHIEAGNRLFTQITKDMLLTLPEGDYNITVRNGRNGGSKETVIYRDEETLLDVSDLKGEEIRTGNVFFTLTPQEASVYIDGSKVDTGAAVELEYGIHSMIVTAPGYETISQYLRVGQENANLNVSMERSSSDVPYEEDNNNGITNPSSTPGEGLVTDENGNVVINQPGENPEENALYDSLPLAPGDGTGVNGQQGVTGQTGVNGQQGVTGQTGINGQPGLNTQQPTNENTISADDSSYQVRVSAPAGAEVYVDGSYVGIAPVTFKKKPGGRVITLKKSGYQQRSYTVQVDNTPEELQLSFSELEPSASQAAGSSALTSAIINTLTGGVLNGGVQ